MDRNAPAICVEANASESCEHTVQLIHHCRELAGKEEAPLVQPILTPRFAISCSSELLAGIGKLAKAYPDRMWHAPDRSSLADAHLREQARD